MKHWLLHILAFLFILSSLSAQDFSGTPADIRWMQIKTDTARIIYPAGEDSLAQRVAALVHYQQRTFSHTLGNDLHPVQIVLRNELTYFNGYVQLGPFRSEYYLTPQQDAFELGAQSPTDLLSIHEYRHVEQYNNFRKGLSKAAYVLFGQNGQALANDAAIPNWFFEGDAVYNETLLSTQGRGRLPNFFNGYKALYFDNRHYSYMKLRNGSFKDYMPDHYPLGYMLVSYGREQYGDEFWKKVTDDAARFKPLFYPLQGSVKAESGLPFRQYVQNAFAFYQQQWKEEKRDSVSWLTPQQKHNVVSYRYPYRDETGGIIILKESYKTLPRFYRISKDGNETEIALQSITNDNYFSYNNGRVVYAAYQPSTRWAYREYSVIKLLDIHTKRERRITFKTRYYSPDISHDGKLIAAVSVTPQQHSSIDVMSATGFAIASMTNQKDEIYSYPKFSADDKDLYFIVRRTSGEMSLQQWNLSTQKTMVLLPFANRILGFPQVQGDTLIYSCSNKGKDEIWAYIASQNEHYRLANYQTGLYGAVINDKAIIASAFTSSGYRLGSFAPQWQPLGTSADVLTGLYVKKPFGNPANETVSATPQTDRYPTQRYPKLSHPFNFHSLQPDYSDPIFSLTLYGENILSTIQNQIYYTYNRNEGYNQVGYDIVYGASFLQPFLDVSETFGRNAYRQNQRFSYNELNGIAGLQLPLNVSGGKEYRYLTLLAAYGFENTQFTGAAKDIAGNFTNGYVETRVSFVNQRQRALQHIYPHWAQSISMQYRALTSTDGANQFLARGALYLPALLSSHSLVCDGAFEHQSFQHSGNFFNYSLSDDFPYSRGYSAIPLPSKMYKAGINYHLPLSYPDFGIASIVYFRRLRANLFFDYTHLEGTFNQQPFKLNLKSTGAELYLDTRWWNQQNITLGLRYSHLIDYRVTGEQPNQWTLILPSSIFQ